MISKNECNKMCQIVNVIQYTFTDIALQSNIVDLSEKENKCIMKKYKVIFHTLTELLRIILRVLIIMISIILTINIT